MNPPHGDGGLPHAVIRVAACGAALKDASQPIESCSCKSIQLIIGVWLNQIRDSMLNTIEMDIIYTWLVVTKLTSAEWPDATFSIWNETMMEHGTVDT